MERIAGPVLVEYVDDIVTITLNRPAAMNGVDMEMARALAGVFDELKGKDAVRAVILTAAGKYFCAGADFVSTMEVLRGPPQEAKAYFHEIVGLMNDTILAMSAITAPIICAVRGGAAGAGFSLLCACDFVVSSADARFLAAFCGIGASPDTGITVMLPQIVGRRRAREIILLNEILDVQTAYQDRIVTQICPSDDVLKEARAMADRIAAMPVSSIRSARKLLELESSHVAACLERERETLLKVVMQPHFLARLEEMVRRKQGG